MIIQIDTIQKSIDELLGDKNRIDKLYQLCKDKGEWNGIMGEDLVKYTKNFFIANLQKLQNKVEILDGLSISSLSNIQSLFQQLQSAFSQFQSLDLAQITTHHHQTLSSIDQIMGFLQTNGISTKLEISSAVIKKANIDFSEIKPFLDCVMQDKPNYENALNSLQKLVDKQGEVNEAILHGQADAFKKRAEAYDFIPLEKNNVEFSWKNIYNGSFFHGGYFSWWLLGALFFAILALVLITILAFKSEPIDIGNAIESYILISNATL